jgi:hypothetical protein
VANKTSNGTSEDHHDDDGIFSKNDKYRAILQEYDGDMSVLYNQENMIGVLGDNVIRILFSIQHNIDVEDRDYEICSRALLSLYKKNLKTLNTIVLDWFKNSSYFRNLISCIERDTSVKRKQKKKQRQRRRRLRRREQQSHANSFSASELD